MPRCARKVSSSCLYHVVSRGVSHQIIFEDDGDRTFFMSKVVALLEPLEGSLFCWCLMDNHFHLLVKMDVDNLSRYMRLLLSDYAGYFNRVHERSGILFDDRFRSEPVETDEYLMSVVRYIHRNPVKAGLGSLSSYRWSSYGEYVSRAQRIDAEAVLDVFGGIEQFVAFHGRDEENANILEERSRPRRLLSDSEAMGVARRLLGGVDPSSVKSHSRDIRDSEIATLKSAGLSVRQIRRLTGLSLGTISKIGVKGVK